MISKKSIWLSNLNNIRIMKTGKNEIIYLCFFFICFIFFIFTIISVFLLISNSFYTWLLKKFCETTIIIKKVKKIINYIFEMFFITANIFNVFGVISQHWYAHIEMSNCLIFKRVKYNSYECILNIWIFPFCNCMSVDSVNSVKSLHYFFFLLIHLVYILLYDLLSSLISLPWHFN